jgi:hypothetical protein
MACFQNVSFCVFLNYRKQKVVCCKHHIHMIYIVQLTCLGLKIPYVLHLYVSLSGFIGKIFSCTHHIHEVYPHYVLFYVFLNCWILKIVSGKHHIHMFLPGV